MFLMYKSGTFKEIKLDEVRLRETKKNKSFAMMIEKEDGTGYEDNTVTIGTSKIGLMYLSDYYYAQVAGGTTNCYSSCSNWMTLGSLEWTMSNYGSYGSNYRAWRVGPSGIVSYPYLNNTNSVRPVFYLESDVSFDGGTGANSDPFIIN